MASSRFQLVLGISSSSPTSTAASATSAPAGGAEPSARVTRTLTLALSRTLYTCRSVSTRTFSSLAAQPTRTGAIPSL
ncbi:hypothetical protein DUPY_39260 [Duganella phyllosphaerae]|uniref:Secreted protein n=1 Tax=Duganella phyllosphaerae TaxID=762836 RepID=A0A1E7WEF5_9BURK|nr:hypothetical protein DUPY_39260 [Duganella phyllosphaerae]